MSNRLVCIRDTWRNNEKLPYPFPKKGEIYTLDGIDNGGVDPPYFFLKEFTWRAPDGARASFAHQGFREVDDTFGQYCEDIYLSIAQVEEAIKEGAI